MIELELEPHQEALASTAAEGYEVIARALSQEPLYHQWRTYRALFEDNQIVVNSYNTGTGKTKAALLHLLHLNECIQRDRLARANVLFIAPTNELLRQHEEDIRKFVQGNDLSYIVLRLDAATIKELAAKHLSGKFLRQGDRLHQMLQDPRSVSTDEHGHHIDGQRPYVLVINPDIFYYALYGLGNPHEQRVLFRAFMMLFHYTVIDEFHYYNAKQLANFLFFLTLSKQWGYFSEGRKVCLLSATPNAEVRKYLERLQVHIAYVTPGDEPSGLRMTAALAPIRLHLWSTEALEDGLVSLARQEMNQVLDWLASGRHGAFISSALWRINSIFAIYGGKSNEHIGRLTGAEKTEWRKKNTLAPLLMATPTVDIGYNFVRDGKTRQSIDFLFFDARSADELIQRLGRAGRVLGKSVYTEHSDVHAVVPDELITELRQFAGSSLTRSDLNSYINSVLPPKNGLYAYIHSGAIAEAFLPLYHFYKALPATEKQRAEQLYTAIADVYNMNNKRNFNALSYKIRTFLALKSYIPALLKEASEKHFTFGPASTVMRTMDERHDVTLEDLSTITLQATQVENSLRNHSQAREKAIHKRREEIEEYFLTEARFNFRDNYQPPQALAYDPQGLLSTAEYTLYSALHIVQNYESDWYDSHHHRYQAILQQAGISADEHIQLCCAIRKARSQRLSLYFHLQTVHLRKKQWEDRYCSRLAATNDIVLYSDGGPIPAEINDLFEQQYLTFYAVPMIGPEAFVLKKLSKMTSLFTNTLHIDFGEDGEHEYMMVVGNAALLVAHEPRLVHAKYAVKRASSRGSHIFDWDEEL